MTWPAFLFLFTSLQSHRVQSQTISQALNFPLGFESKFVQFYQVNFTVQDRVIWTNRLDLCQTIPQALCLEQIQSCRFTDALRKKRQKSVFGGGQPPRFATDFSLVSFAFRLHPTRQVDHQIWDVLG